MEPGTVVGFDAFLLASFGGPEGPAEVMPFLENVVRGRNVPRARLEAVAEHYRHFGGRSPINEQNRALVAALQEEFQSHGLKLPIYFGNRNWRPYLADVMRQLKADGVRRALGFFTSVFSSYSSCRQYREDIEAARRKIGDQAPEVHKLRPFFNHPGFVEATADRVRAALGQIPEERRPDAPLVFTTHSIPRAMAKRAPYEGQFLEASRLVAETVGRERWQLAYQSRSGPAEQPWLEPDICDLLDALRKGLRKGDRHLLPERPEGCFAQKVPVTFSVPADVVVVPIGFLSDHIEILWDLDTEARAHGEALGLNLVRAATVGTHPRFVAMVRELVAERIEGRQQRSAGGAPGPCGDACPPDCCLQG